MKSKQFLSNNHIHFGIIPDDWKWKTIDEIKGNGKSLVSGPFGSNIGKRFFRPTGVPVIRGNNLKHDKFIDSGFVFVDDEKAEELKNCVALQDDVIFTAAGTIGQVGIIPKNGKYTKYIISNKQLRLRLDTAIVNPLFAFYWFSSKKMQEYLIILNVGSALPLLTLRELKSVPIPIPSLTIQNRIAIILNNFYEKIENLQNQNHILEQTAQIIFKSWFVDFDGVTEFDDSELGKIPKKWRVTKLGEHTTIKGRIGWKGLTQSEYADIGYHLVTGRQIVNETVDWESCPRVSEERYLESPEIMLKKNDILMSKDGTIGRLSFIHELFFQASVGTGIFVIRSNSDYIDQYFLLAFFKSNIFKEIVKSRTEGSVIPHLYQRDIKDFNLALAPKPLIQKFSKIYERITQLQFSNSSQIEKLTKTRDALLPKLMSGEIRV